MSMSSAWRKVRARAARVIRSRHVKWSGAIALALLLLFLFRFPILRGMGAYLITEDDPVHCDAIYVLGGASLDRGHEAARLYSEGWSRALVFTGAMVPAVFLVEGIDKTEAEVSRDAAMRSGAPPEACSLLLKGTSTREEAEAIIEHARFSHADTVMILSSLFHLRRVDHVFRDRFSEAGIQVVLRGAPSTQFDERQWWQKEEGLLMLNNEYVKLLYYWIKY